MSQGDGSMRRIVIWLLCFFLSFTSLIRVRAEELPVNEEETSEVSEEETPLTEGESQGEESPEETAIPEENEIPEETVTQEPVENEEIQEEESVSETEEEPQETAEPSEELSEDGQPEESVEEEAANEEILSEENTKEEETETSEPEEASEEETEIVEEEKPLKEEEQYPDADLSYRAYVRGAGWTGYTTDRINVGEYGKTVEAIQVVMPDSLKDKGYVYVQTHVSGAGWKQSVGPGKTAGTTGEGRQLEALRVYLSPDLSKEYDVWYRTYCAGAGWMGWTKNGGISGTIGYGYPVQKVVLDLQKKGKGGRTEGVSYKAKAAVPSELKVQAHVHNIGWMKEVGPNQTAGTTGQSKAIEALAITLPVKMVANGDVRVQAHVQNKGWMTSVGNGRTAGTTGQNLRMEAVRVYLTSGLANQYDIWYRVHSANVGWLGWTKNGGIAGTLGYNQAIEAIQVDIVPKGSSAHSASTSYRSKTAVPSDVSIQGHVQNIGWMSAVGNDKVVGTVNQGKRLEAFRLTLPVNMLELGNVSIQAHVQNLGWMGAKKSGEQVGTTGRNLRMEALKISLTGNLASRYDVFYRVHVSGSGWLGWTKNGGSAGSSGWAKAIEAVQICFAAKNTNPYTTGKAYIDPPVQTVPVYYSQTDGRWASVRYGAWNMYTAGCVPTCLAMIFSGLSGRSIIPTDVASWLYNNTNDFNKRVIGGCGPCAPKAAAAWGFQSKGIGTAGALSSELALGRPVIAVLGPGTFAASGASHAVVLFQYSGAKTYVYDPWSSARNGWYNVNSLFSQKSTDPDDNIGGYTFYSIFK